MFEVVRVRGDDFVDHSLQKNRDNHEPGLHFSVETQRYQCLSGLASKSTKSWVKQEEILRVTRFEESDPRLVLGPHTSNKATAIRAFLPLAERAWVQHPAGFWTVEMNKLTSDGFYEALFEESFDGKRLEEGYLIGYEDSSGFKLLTEDPYCFEPTISDYELYLFGKGELQRSYDTLGAHLKVRNGVPGVAFAVWAPNARAVSVVGNFNHWTVGAHPMINRGASGVWELFVPRLKEEEVYKYAVKFRSDGSVKQRTDPYAFKTELRPHTASVVTNLNAYEWGDTDWMAQRRTNSVVESPISIYELHLGSWKRKQDEKEPFFGYKEIAEELIPYVKQMGYTHVELLPVMEHPFDGSWGYQVINYYAPTARYGAPQDLMFFIDQCHRSGLGVILDWVPAHFPKDDYGLSFYDGSHLYEPDDPLLREHPDWGTLVFNYGRNEVRNFLVSNALFWLEKYHVDGLRIDAVSSMLYLDYSRRPGQWRPNKYGGRENLEAISFLQQLNSVVHQRFPGAVVIAEESTAWGGVSRPVYSGGLGFDFKWNMGWMHDTLEYFSTDPLYRKFVHAKLTFSLWYAFSENFILPLSHDEVVHGKGSMLSKMPGDEWQKFANLRLCYAYMFGHPGKKLMFMGDELGEPREWSESRSLDWELLKSELHKGVNLLVRDLNTLYRTHSALHTADASPAGFEWIDFGDALQSVISFLRYSKDRKDFLVFVCNMTPLPRHSYRIGVPIKGYYKEVLNTDASEYGGSGVGNFGGVHSEDLPFHGRPYSVSITLPPLGALVFQFSTGSKS
jgi:1,4-alpha-glucan branching enzyme